MKTYPDSRVERRWPVYRHYKRSARRTWRHPPDASVRLAAQRRARAGLGTAARRAQSAQTRTHGRPCVERSASHTAHVVLLGAGGVARGRRRKRKARVRVTERTPVRGPNGRKEKARRNDGEGEREERERTNGSGWMNVRTDGRTNGRTDERTDGRACGRMCESANGGGREPVRERDGARVEGQRASERGLVARFGTV